MIDAQKEGFLTKRGAENKGWRKRWFILTNGKLYYFENQKSQKAKGVIELESCAITDITPSYFRKEKRFFCFQISCDARTYYLSAVNEVEVAEWIDVLKKETKNLKPKPFVPKEKHDERLDGLLAYEAQQEDVEKLIVLLKKGADSNVEDPLFQAVNTRSSRELRDEKVRILLQCGCDPNGPKNKEALLVACSRGYYTTTAILLVGGSNVNTLYNTTKIGDGVTPLHIACIADATNAEYPDGFLETVKILVEYEADISKYTESGYTPLMIAADFGRTDLLELLIKNGGKVDDINPKDKNTALHYACKKCNETVIQLLLANNATKKY